MKTVRHTSTLFYYDGPQVFEARDTIGGHYIALTVEPQNGHDCYLVKGIAPERLRQFRSGTRDLRSLLIEGSEEEWYMTTPTADLGQPLSLVPQNISIMESGFLPDEGFFLHDHPTESHVLREARQRNNLVLEITADPPEAAEEHRIRVDTFTELLDHVQKMVKYAYKAALKELSSINPLSNTEDAHVMDVAVPAKAGSFRVVLVAARMPDLFGNGDLPRALQLVGVLFKSAANPQEAPEALKKYRGHLAGSYMKFLNFLKQHQTGLRYSWAEPTSPKPTNGAISESEAASLLEVLSGVSALGQESVTLVGEFVKVNRDAGGWGLCTEEGTKSGSVGKNGPSLNGLEVGKRYKFHCVEEIEEVVGTGRETHTLSLNKYEPA